MPPLKSYPASVTPPLLKKGGTIGIVSPSRWPEPEWIDKGKMLLEDEGYQVVVHAQNYLKDGRLAGQDAARAEAIMDMFADSTIDAVVCARGGAGAIRILDKLDYKLIKKNPKPFVGFSDATALLHAIQRKTGFVTYHGPMLWNLAHPHDPRTLDDLLGVLVGEATHRWKHYPEAVCLKEGRVEGALIGGNLTLLQNLIGTPYDWSAKDAILFIEDVSEPYYVVDRALHHLRLAGKFNGVRAVIVGEMVKVPNDEHDSPPYGRDLRQMLAEVLPPDVPVCVNFPCGHGTYLTTLPLGGIVKVTFGAKGAEIEFGSDGR